jgi:hypothetical protein
MGLASERARRRERHAAEEVPDSRRKPKSREVEDVERLLTAIAVRTVLVRRKRDGS